MPQRGAGGLGFKDSRVRTAVVPPAGLGNAVVTVIRAEGFPALYKGLAPTLVGIAPYAAINFASYDLLKRHYYGDGSDRRWADRRPRFTARQKPRWGSGPHSQVKCA